MHFDFIEKLDHFLRKWMIKTTIIISIVILSVLFYFNNDALIIFVKYLNRGSNSINTMASIFTGIYFSLCTLMLSLPAFSRIRQLGKKNYHSLLKILFFGLLWSLSYSLWQIVISFSNNEFLLIINFLLMLGFILSVLQSTLYFSIILGQDLINSYEASDEMSRDIQTIKRMLEEIERKEEIKRR